jgi:hypothetical protein
MFNKISAPLCALFTVVATLLLCGCQSDEISVYEVLQIPDSAKVYTAHNLWYNDNPGDDEEEISALNYQKGMIIPFGTEVKIDEVDDDCVTFTTVKDGRQYELDFPQKWMLFPVREYIKQAFTGKSEQDLEKEIAPEKLKFIKKGIVEKGMTREEVILAYGYPAPFRTPSLEEDTWIYWTEPMRSKRVVFKKDKVTAIFSID